MRDFSAAELGGADPGRVELLHARARAARLNETRVRARAEHPEETRQTLTKAELTTVPGTIGDPLRVLQNMPGVARAPFGLGLLIVRGANPTDTGVFIGGEPIPVLYHFLAGPSVFTANLIDKIDFYPGGFGVRYGRFIGGVVDVNIKGDVGRTLHGAVDINLRDSSAYVEGPAPGGVRTSFAVRRSYIDALLPYFPISSPRIGSTFVTVAPVYWDYQARVDKDVPGGGRVALLAYGSSDSLEVIAQDPTVELESNTHIGFHHVMGEWVTSLGRLELAPVGDLRLRRPELLDQHPRRLPALSPPLWARGLQPALQLRAGGCGGAGLRPQLRLGALHNLPFPRDGRTIGTTMPPQMIDVTRSLYDTAPARLCRGAVEPHAAACASSRACASTTTTWSRPTSSRSIPGWRFAGTLTPRLALKAAVGIYHQLPNPQFLDRVYGNPNLALPWADQYQIGVERRFTEADELTATLFFVRRHDLPVASPDHFSSTGPEPRVRARAVASPQRHRALLRLDRVHAVALRRSRGRWRRASRCGGNNGMPRNGADLAWRPGPFDQTHNLIVVASYRFRDWETGASYRLVTGTPRTPVVGSFYDADFGTYTRVKSARRARRATRPSASSTCASSGASPSIAGCWASTSTSSTR